MPLSWLASERRVTAPEWFLASVYRGFESLAGSPARRLSTQLSALGSLDRLRISSPTGQSVRHIKPIHRES